MAQNEIYASLLLLFNLAVGFYSVGAVWLVQLSAYPLWAHVGPKEFHGYHVFWWHSIWGPVLFPATLEFIGALAMIWLRPPHVAAGTVWLAVIFQVLYIIGTAAWWGPLMARLTEAPGPRYSLLMTTHWLRVALITAYALVVFGMAVKSFTTV